MYTLVWRAWWQLVTKVKHDEDGIIHMLQGCFPYVEELTSWLMMILVESYRDGMLSRTTTISGGGGCKVFFFSNNSNAEI